MTVTIDNNATETQDTQAAYTFTAYASELARVLGNVLPHAANDDTLPAIRCIGFVETSQGFALTATDRYTLAMATGSRFRLDDAPNAMDTLRAGVAPVFKLTYDDAKALLADAKRLKVGLVTVGLGTTGALSVDSADGTYRRTFTTAEGEFPRYGKLVPSVDDLNGAAGTAMIGLSPVHLAKFCKIAPASVAAHSGRANKANEPLRLRLQASDRPVLVTCGETLAAILMPVKLSS